MNQPINTKIITWYDKFGRKNLPWQGSNSYHVWVSEIMLQQTQVLKVMEYFAKFVRKFPSLESLAQAKVDDVLAHWSGLGYYNRARNLHKTAVICHKDFNNKLPKNLKNLMDLPGIGRTTAGAIMSLAHDLPFPILDGNVKRVMSRVFTIKSNKLSELNKQLWQCVSENMPQVNCRKYNQALMDLGSLICKNTQPKCTQCPLINDCKALKNDQIALYPQKNKKTKQIKLTNHVLMLINQERIFLEKRKENGIWPQLWFFPTFDSQEKMLQSELMKRVKIQKVYKFNVQHILSHRKLDLQVHCYADISALAENESEAYQWVGLSNVKGLPHPRALTKIINRYLAHEIT